MVAEEKTGLLVRFFAGLTEQTFQSRLGVADPILTDYLTDMLVRFVHNDKIYRLRSIEGYRLEEVAEMLLEGEERIGDARREVHRHIGDFTLFWTGIYPESLMRLRGRNRKDFFIDYCSQGKKSYYIASTIPVDEESAENKVLKRLSEDFELCVYGLGEIRREWERRDGDDTAEIRLIWQ